MSERKSKGVRRTTKPKPPERGGDEPRPLGETWDQEQRRYPAPERPRDRAEERKRRA